MVAIVVAQHIQQMNKRRKGSYEGFGLMFTLVANDKLYRGDAEQRLELILFRNQD